MQMQSAEIVLARQLGWVGAGCRKPGLPNCASGRKTNFATSLPEAGKCAGCRRLLQVRHARWYLRAERQRQRHKLAHKDRSAQRAEPNTPTSYLIPHAVLTRPVTALVLYITRNALVQGASKKKKKKKKEQKKIQTKNNRPTFLFFSPFLF
jgi:hypothetical protein